jgi:hypothetical protein
MLTTQPISRVVSPNTRSTGVGGPWYIRTVSNTRVIPALTASATAALFAFGTSKYDQLAGGHRIA